MEKIVDKIANLMTPRKIIAILLTLVGCYLWLTGQADLKDAFLLVIGYYFGKSTALDVPGKDS